MKRLVLFDIDGTLLSARGAPRRAFHRALLEVYGTAGPIDSHTFNGKTDPQIARELLRLDGVADDIIEGAFARLWETYLRELRLEFAIPGHETHVYPGVRELLRELERLQHDVVIGLLTGNIREGAAMKLASARIETPFPVGAFGSDHERRDQLPAVAVARARELTGVHFQERAVVVIGDTPADVTCGRALCVRAIGVGTGGHPLEELAAEGAHAVFPDLADTAAVLAAVLD